MKKSIYFDYNASTPVDPEVLSVMIPYFNTYYANPSSSTHSMAWSAQSAVENARSQISGLLNSEPSEIIFTSGATESVNISHKGVLYSSPRTTLITSQTEHAATYETALYLQNKDFNVIILNVDQSGLIPLNDLENELKKFKSDQIPFVSLIFGHNEIGSLYDLNRLMELKSKFKFLLHLDITQSLMTQKIDTKKHDIDMMSFSSHKLYGPKGTGVLFINKKTIGYQLETLIHGGGQEHNLRSGTLNVPGIVGLGKACELIEQHRERDCRHFLDLKNNLIQNLKSKKIEFNINGSLDRGLPNTLNITLGPKYKDIDLKLTLPEFCFSQGAACGSQGIKPNRTLKALGLSENEMQRTLRIGFGRETLTSELELFVERLAAIV